MFRVVALAVCLQLLALSSLAAADEPEIVKKLTSPDRATRFEGIDEVAGLKTIPADVAQALVDSLRLELAHLHEPAKKQADPPELLPSTGSETPLIRVKASPRDYIDERFIVIGHAQISDYYNWGYRAAQGTHYSFQLRDAHGGRTIAHLYLMRGMGDSIAEQLTRNVERGIPSTPIRAVVSIDSDRKPMAETWDMLEVHDVQFLDDKNQWDFPLVGGARSLYRQLDRCGKDAAPGLAAAIIEPGDTTRDKVIRGQLLKVIAGMDKTGRAAAIASLRKIERDTKGKEERARVRTIMEALDKAGREADLKAAKAKAKKR